MNLPDLLGTTEPSDFVIYAACDSHYFAEFGPAFVGSIRSNTSYNIHIHLFNPSTDQIDYCQQRGVSVTWEYAHLPLFSAAAQRWRSVPEQEPQKSQYERTLNAMQKGKDSSILERMQKTYYACARFVRLNQIYQGNTVLAIDIDAVVRKPVPELAPGPDFYIHHISGKRARYLAGGLWLNAGTRCQQFLTEYEQGLLSYFEQDYLYWGLDQDLLDSVVPRYQHGQLPMEMIDWNMKSHSSIWTAKGTRKELDVFVNEQRKYTS